MADGDGSASLILEQQLKISLSFDYELGWSDSHPSIDLSCERLHHGTCRIAKESCSAARASPIDGGEEGLLVLGSQLPGMSTSKPHVLRCCVRCRQLG